jgi:hypothetical protein
LRPCTDSPTCGAAAGLPVHRWQFNDQDLADLAVESALALAGRDATARIFLAVDPHVYMVVVVAALVRRPDALDAQPAADARASTGADISWACS